MSIRNRSKAKRLVDFAQRCYSKLIEIKKINQKRRKKIWASYHLTGEESRAIQKFYVDYYGKKIPLKWHRYYAAFHDKVDVAFFPELLFIPVIMKTFNGGYEGLADKNLLPLLLNDADGLYTAEILIKRIKGQFYTGGEAIGPDKAAALLEGKGKLFIKPSIDTNSGIGCAAISFEGGKDEKTGRSFAEIAKAVGDDFNVQRFITNSNSLKALHPQSLNTLRITTYILDGKVYHFPVAVRMGRGNNYLDNIHAGGLFIGVNDDGTLLEFAVDEYCEKYYSHPDTGLIFKGHKIEKLPEILQRLEKQHRVFPMVGMISWDVTVDENDRIIVVEMNIVGQAVWISQMAHGKGAFGENTARVLQMIKGK